MTADSQTGGTADGVATQDASDAADVPHRGRRLRRAAGILFVGVGIALWLAPLGIARYLESHGYRLTAAGGEEAVFDVRIGSVSLGWISPVRLADVRIVDSAGQTLLSVERVVSEQSLFGIVANPSRPGRFFLDRPHVEIIVRPDGSNLEDFLGILESRRRKPSGLSRFGATLTDGVISFLDANDHLLAKVENINVNGERRRDAAQAIEFELRAVVVDADQQRRDVEAAARWTGPNDRLPFLSGAGTTAVKFDPFPLSVAEPYLTRIFPDLTILSGTLSGQLLVDADFGEAGTLTVTGNIVGRDIHALQPRGDGTTAEFRWPEERVEVHLDGAFDAASQSVQLSEVRLQSTPVAIAASGHIDDLTGECRVDIAGDLRYDVNPLLQSLTAEVQQHVQVDGLQTRTFSIEGPLARIDEGRPRWDLSRLSVEADLAWEAADVFGVRSEHANVVTRLENGVVHVDPREVPVSGGHFRAAPDISFLGAEPTASVGEGPALENVQFTPEMCHLWMKYLSPVLADATRVEGQFSIHLDQAQVPVLNAAQSRVSGLLHVHEAEIRPGPFAEQIVGLVGTMKSLIDRRPGGLSSDRLTISMHDQQVPFAMADGRVHHQRLEFLVAGAVVRTSGSVGLDESLDLVIEIPLPAAWFKQPLLADTFRDEVVRIPVRGSFRHPQFELTAFRELMRRLALKATGGLLQKLLD